jgi:hypothetical protein
MKSGTKIACLSFSFDLVSLFFYNRRVRHIEVIVVR